MDRRATGPGAGAIKYDILTALGLIGLRGSPGLRNSVQRLIVLVTARYNWRADEVSVGQADLARLWAVDARTVKREVKRLTEAGILLRIRAGVRGRVAAYRLNLAEIAARSMAVWGDVGPDFAARMAELMPATAKVVPLHPGPAAPDTAKADTAETDGEDGQGGDWAAVRRRLRVEDPALFASWFDGLRYLGREGDAVVLAAATPFVGRYVETHLARRLSEAISAELGPCSRLLIRCSA